MSDVVRVEALCRTFRTGAIEVQAVRGVSFSIEEGAMVAIMGPSGSGKTTLMNMLGCLDRPTGGRYFLGGDDVAKKSDDALAAIRNRRIGFIFQNYNLLPALNALENVELPLVYRGMAAGERHLVATQVLAEVGLGELVSFRPYELSGGQQQRVGIARALAGKPNLLLADEPTGNLDSASGEEILNLFLALNAAGRTVIIVTHDEQVALHCERIIRLKDGEILSDRPVAADSRRMRGDLGTRAVVQ
ncbi:MAG: ABC transporter ATP-binding protein [Sulfobacillus sp.]